MDDYISRQDAIDLLEKWSGGYDYIETETESAIEAFEKIPSAQPYKTCDGCTYERYGSVNCDFCSRYHMDRYERRTE